MGADKGRVLRVRLCEADREEYGGPEWLELDRDVLDDTRADELHEIEAEMDLSFSMLFVEEVALRTARARKAVAWLALRQAGILHPWNDFQPRVLRSEFRAGGDVPPVSSPSSDGPPGGGSSESSAGDQSAT